MVNCYKYFLLSFLFIFGGLSTQASAQNLLDNFDEEESTNLSTPGENAPQLYTETIKNISPSKKIFILTNNNHAFSKGDFISILLTNKLVTRALVAKTTDENMSGIKILKIYDTDLWNQLKVGKDVLVLKGDDSYYANLGKTPTKAPPTKINDEEDLFNESTFNDDDAGFDENSKRLIKPDNLVSAMIGMLPSIDNEGNSTRYTHFQAAWGYQVADNVWAELTGGMNRIVDYPVSGLNTELYSITAKLKLTFAAPFDSYLLPYAGYKIVLANSKDAGVDDGSTSQEDLDLESQAVEDLKENTFIFGATILKRIVPGWFIRADLGSDIIAGGLTIEF